MSAATNLHIPTGLLRNISALNWPNSRFAIVGQCFLILDNAATYDQPSIGTIYDATAVYSRSHTTPNRPTEMRKYFQGPPGPYMPEALDLLLPRQSLA
jgi:hypothetical protein